jgi:hypothetical protein
MAAHADELSGDLLWALGELHETRDHDADVASRIRELNPSYVTQLCAAIEGVHRSYFGTMNGRELSAFIHCLADENSTAQYG